MLKHLVVALTAAWPLAGCANFRDEQGRRVSLRDHDCVIVEQVTVSEGVNYPEMVGCLEAAVQLELLDSDEWHRGREGDIRVLLAQAGLPDPFDPHGPQSDAVRLRHQQRWERCLKKPKGTRPVRLRAEITKVRFPSWSEMTVLGATCYAYCQVRLFDSDGIEKLGEARVFAAPELPRLGVWNTALVGVLTNVIRYKEYDKEDRLILARDLARQIVRTLNRAKHVARREKKHEIKRGKRRDAEEKGAVAARTEG